jgi:hypothetical protein
VALGDADLPGILGELGVPVVFGATTTTGILDQNTDQLFQGDDDSPELLGAAVVVVVQTASLPGIQAGSSITVNGVPYVVLQRLRMDDGALTRLACAVSA